MDAAVEFYQNLTFPQLKKSRARTELIAFLHSRQILQGFSVAHRGMLSFTPIASFTLLPPGSTGKEEITRDRNRNHPIALQDIFKRTFPFHFSLFHFV